MVQAKKSRTHPEKPQKVPYKRTSTHKNPEITEFLMLSLGSMHQKTNENGSNDFFISFFNGAEMESLFKGITRAGKPFSLRELIFAHPTADKTTNKPIPMEIAKSFLIVGEAGSGKIPILSRQVGKEASKRPIYMVVVTRSAYKWHSIKNVEMRVFEDKAKNLDSYQNEFDMAMSMAKAAKENGRHVIVVLDNAEAALSQLVYFKNMVEGEAMKFVAMRQELSPNWKDVPLIQSFSAVAMFGCKKHLTLDCLVKARPTVSDTQLFDIRCHKPGQYLLLE
jgi:hypothetical protein